MSIKVVLCIRHVADVKMGQWRLHSFVLLPQWGQRWTGNATNKLTLLLVYVWHTFFGERKEHVAENKTLFMQPVSSQRGANDYKINVIFAEVINSLIKTNLSRLRKIRCSAPSNIALQWPNSFKMSWTWVTLFFPYLFKVGHFKWNCKYRYKFKWEVSSNVLY